MAHIQYPIQAIQGHKAHTYTQTLFKPFLYPTLFLRRVPFKPSFCLTSFQRSTRDAQMTQKLLFYSYCPTLFRRHTKCTHNTLYLPLYFSLFNIVSKVHPTISLSHLILEAHKTHIQQPCQAIYWPYFISRAHKVQEEEGAGMESQLCALCASKKKWDTKRGLKWDKKYVACAPLK